MRPVTPEIASFVHARTAEHLKAASSAHTGRIAECREGRGVDRHLFGLKKMMELFGREIGVEETPGLFSSPGYLALSRNLLSTSTGPTEGFRIYGFGPVDDEGFGVRYLMFPEKLVFTMTSRTTLEPRLLAFREKLADNLEKMAALLSE
jgi:carnitine O-acetyltransferase